MKRTGPPARRTPLRAHTAIRRTSTLAPVSTKRARANRTYSTLRRDFLADHSLCEICTQPATDVHHRRGRVGADLLDQDHWTALCRGCHRVVTDNPAWAVASGWSERRIERMS